MTSQQIMDGDRHPPGDRRAPRVAKSMISEDGGRLGASGLVLRESDNGRKNATEATSFIKGVIPPYTLAAGSPARVIRSVRGA